MLGIFEVPEFIERGELGIFSSPVIYIQRKSNRATKLAPPLLDGMRFAKT